jgi:hypothetical protein
VLASLIYVGVTADSAATFVEVDVEIADPAARARGLLDEHRSCERIEVWRDERCLCVVGRAGDISA